uniref:DUF4140 domain-containing protein n=1 Tax=Ditylenchus dipsaci TaxID=166011 RepID=A0A915DX73_9BILA
MQLPPKMSETKENLLIHQHQQPYPIEHFDVRNLPVKNVIVYAERAEVKRCLRVFAAAGRTNLVINNISPVIERQSIRVEVRKQRLLLKCATTNAQSMPLTVKTPSLRMEKEKSALMSAKTALEDHTMCLAKTRSTGWSGWSNRTECSSHSGHRSYQETTSWSSASSAFLLCEDAMKNLTSFLDFYGKSAIAIKNKLEVLERELDQLRCKSEYDTHKRHLHIVIEMEEMEQKTDEDWKDAEIILSTATPCFAGVVPTLPTLVAEFKRQPFHRSRSALRRKLISNESQEEDVGIGSFDYNEYTDALALQRLTVTATNTQCTNSDHDPAMPSELVPSTYFPVEIPATITGMDSIIK